MMELDTSKDVLHESCAATSFHWCQLGRRNSHQQIISDSRTENTQDDMSWRFLSLPTPATSQNDYEYNNTNEYNETCSIFGEEESHFSNKLSFSSAAMTMTGLIKVAQWLSHRRKSKEISKANAADKHVKGKFGLLDEKLAQKQLKMLIKHSQKRASLSVMNQSSQESAATYRRALFRHSQHRSFIISPNTSFSSSGCVSSASSIAQANSDNNEDLSDRRMQLLETSRRKSLQICKDFGDKKKTKYNQRTLYEDQLLLSTVPNREVDLKKGKAKQQYFGSKAKTLSFELQSSPVENICATWPQTDTTISSINQMVGDDESGFEDDTSQQSHNDCVDVKEVLKEWCIPFQDLQFKERIRKGRHGDIYRGHWHGDVFIYTFNNYQNLTKFCEEVAQLCLIRHENIMLFMGTSIDTQPLTIITSMCKGHSLFQLIHIKNQSLSVNIKLNISRQITQGMSYLHAKGIVHKRLNSVNIILENSRVKICLMDQAMPKVEFDRNDWGCVTRGQLAYFSPELMRSIQIEPPHVYPAEEFSQESDVYSFGTILFEIIHEKYPFEGMDSHTVIYSIGTGHHDDVSKLKCNNTLKSLILQCWSMDPAARPKFSTILRQLMDCIPLQKHHSSSEPDRINKTGLTSLNKVLCS